MCFWERDIDPSLVVSKLHAFPVEFVFSCILVSRRAYLYKIGGQDRLSPGEGMDRSAYEFCVLQTTRLSLSWSRIIVQYTLKVP